jgi:hypothetical protein
MKGLIVDNRYRNVRSAAEAETVVARWRSTATVALDGLALVDNEIEQETR